MIAEEEAARKARVKEAERKSKELESAKAKLEDMKKKLEALRQKKVEQDERQRQQATANATTKATPKPASDAMANSIGSGKASNACAVDDDVVLVED